MAPTGSTTLERRVAVGSPPTGRAHRGRRDGPGLVRWGGGPGSDRGYGMELEPAAPGSLLRYGSLAAQRVDHVLSEGVAQRRGVRLRNQRRTTADSSLSNTVLAAFREPQWQQPVPGARTASLRARRVPQRRRRTVPRADRSPAWALPAGAEHPVSHVARGPSYRSPAWPGGPITTSRAARPSCSGRLLALLGLGAPSIGLPFLTFFAPLSLACAHRDLRAVA